MNQKFYNLDAFFSLKVWNNKQELKSPFDFKRSLKKALSGNYKGLLFAENSLDDKNRDLYLSQTIQSRAYSCNSNHKP